MPQTQIRPRPSARIEERVVATAAAHARAAALGADAASIARYERVAARAAAATAYPWLAVYAAVWTAGHAVQRYGGPLWPKDQWDARAAGAGRVAQVDPAVLAAARAAGDPLGDAVPAAVAAAVRAAATAVEGAHAPYREEPDHV